MAKTNNKSFFVLVGVLIVFCTVSSGVFADQEKSYQQSVNSIAKKIKVLVGNLNANKKLLDDEQSKIIKIEQNIARTQKNILETNKQIKQSKSKNKKIDARLSALLAAQTENKKAFFILMRWRHQHRESSYLKMVLDQKNPYAVGRLNNYYEYFKEAQQQKLDQLHKELVSVNKLRADKVKNLNKLEQQNRAQKEQETILEKNQRRRRATIARLDQKVVSTEKKLDRLRKDRARLDKLLKEIVKHARALKRIEQQRQSEEHRGDERKQTRPIRKLVKGGFTKQRGQLFLPVQGAIRYRFGERIPE